MRANASISDRVTSGAIRASPRLTTRTASASCSGGVFFSRKPLAPARSAWKSCSSTPKVVTTITCGPSAATTFRVTNVGNLPHDFTLGDEAAQDEHEAEMAEMAGNGEMVPDEPNVLSLPPGETHELTWHFTEPGTVLIGCHEIGHYAAGMIATITVES